jgi:hypothetical protein
VITSKEVEQLMLGGLAARRTVEIPKKPARFKDDPVMWRKWYRLTHRDRIIAQQRDWRKQRKAERQCSTLTT